MHQTFYIDADEEISSVIDRLNKSMSVDNYFVVPQRALFLQSIVNLKILKREADKLKKRVIVVTQDEIGISMAERSEVEVRENLEGLEPTSDVSKGEDSEVELEEEQEIEISPKIASNRSIDKNVRLSGMGSMEFFSRQEEFEKSQKTARHLIKQNKAAEKKHAADKKVKKVALTRLEQENALKQKQASKKNGIKIKNPLLLDPQKEKAFEKIFASSSVREEIPKHLGSGKTKKIFLTFIFLCIFIFAGAVTYLFAPSSKIIVQPNTSVKKVDLDIAGNNNTSSDQTIPIRVFDENQQISLPYDLSTQTVVSGQKAQGSVVIYNEYSGAPQTLMATTRLQTTDGKIFHIVKTVIVPGYTNVNGQIKPGSVQAEIVADQAGSDFNIDPTDFNIPGFQGGPKYDKFHATSSQAAKGGTTTNTQSGVGIVAQSDLDSAKQKAETQFKDQINQDITNQLQSGEVALPQAQNLTITKSGATAKAGDKVGTFSYNVQGTVRVLIFSENDVKKIIQQSIKDDPQIKNAQTDITKVEYGSLDPDFDNENFALKVHGEITITPKIDSVQLKKDLLGKGEDQLPDIMRQYSSIKNVNIEFTPSFINHISQYPQRVNIEIETSGQ